MSSDEAITATCPRCGVEFHAADEDALVSAVQQHVRNDHGFEHELPRKHVLAYLRKSGTTTDAPADPEG